MNFVKPGAKQTHPGFKCVSGADGSTASASLSDTKKPPEGQKTFFSQEDEAEGEAVYTVIDHEATVQRKLSHFQISVSNQ